MYDGLGELNSPVRFCYKSNAGYSIVYAVAMSTLLLAACLAYLKWQSNSHYSSHHQIAEIQAYYTAQAAIIQIPLQHLRATDMRNLQTNRRNTYELGDPPIRE